MNTRISLVPVWFAPDDDVLRLKGHKLTVIAEDGSSFDRFIRLATNQGTDGDQNVSLMLEDPRGECKPRYLPREAVDMIQPADGALKYEAEADLVLNFHLHRNHER